MFKRIPFFLKLASSICGLVISCIVVLLVLNLWQVTNELTTVGRRTIKASCIALNDAISVQRSMAERTNKAALEYMVKVGLQSAVLTSSRYADEIPVVNESGAKKTVSAPKMYSGKVALGDKALVDEVTARFGGFAIVYQMVDNELVPISEVLQAFSADGKTRLSFSRGSETYTRMLAGDGEVHIEAIDGQAQLVAYKPFNILNSEEIGGVFMTGRPLLSEDISTLIGNSTIEGQGFTLLLDGHGQLLQYSGGVTFNTEDMDLLKNMVANAGDFHSFEFKDENYVTYVKYFKPWNWYIVVGMTKANMLQNADVRFFRSNLIAGVALLLAAALAIFWIMRFSTRPIRGIHGFANAVAKGDYNADMEYPAKDIIGSTIDAVQAMVGDLKSKLGFANGLLSGLTLACVVVDTDGKVTFVNNHFLDLFEISGSPKEYEGGPYSRILDIEETVQGIEKSMGDRVAVHNVDFERTMGSGKRLCVRFDAAPLFDLDGNLIGGFALFTDLSEARERQLQIEAKNEVIESGADRAREVSHEMVQASEALSANISQASQGAVQQRSRAAETAVAMEEMNATVQEVAGNASDLSIIADASMGKAREGAQAVQSLVDTIENIERQANQLGENMDLLGNQAEGIGKIIHVIGDIADQTNLLALNAAIEAARAGEAGRGFAVVADEVRKLAEKTMGATNEVDSFIRTILGSIQHSVESTREAVKSVHESSELAKRSGATLAEIVNMVEETSQQVRSIAAAAEQQATSSQEIGKATEEVQRIALETAELMGESEKSLVRMSTIITELVDVIESMRAS